MSKSFYSTAPGANNSFNLTLSNLKNQDELYKYIWIIFMYGLSYFQHDIHPEGSVNLNVYDITMKHVEKVIEYMKSLGISIRFIQLNKSHIEKELQYHIKMYNYDKNKNLSCSCVQTFDTMRLNVANICSEEDRTAIFNIFKKIDYLEYVVNIEQTTQSQLYDFERVLTLEKVVYIIRFTFNYI